VVDVARQGVLDPLREGGDDRALDRLEAVLEKERRERRFEDGGEDVPVADEPRELLLREPDGALGKPWRKVEPAGDDGAAGTRDDVRADLRETPLAKRGEALVQLAGDCKLENAVAEELQPLVRGRGVRGPRRVREDALGVVRWEGVDQPPKGVDLRVATGAR